MPKHALFFKKFIKFFKLQKLPFSFWWLPNFRNVTITSVINFLNVLNFEQ